MPIERNPLKEANQKLYILNILTVCARDATKTKIVNQANLNFKTVTPYIDFIIRKRSAQFKARLKRNI
jgi:predicted transcriptional regulator